MAGKARGDAAAEGQASTELDTQLDAEADELYALTPAEFTAARNARAAASVPALGRAIKTLRKPSAAAFAVDLLARERAAELREALELAAALREAQDDLDADELARLSRQRRQLVAALARTAAGLAEGRRVAISSAAHIEIEETIDAAIRDAAAAAAVLTGRLVRALRADGIDPVDLEGAVGGSVAGIAAVATPAAAPSRDDLAERRARKAAEKEAREAQRLASEAERERGRLEARLTKARERADHLRERVEDLRAELERMTADAESAEDAAAELEDDHAAAAATAEDAGRRADELARKAGITTS